MADLQKSFARWLARLTSLGIDPSTYLNAPADDGMIAQAEVAIGYKFSEDLRRLYRIADGQHRVQALDPAPADAPLLLPLFGGYEFMPLDRAVDDYRAWVDALAEIGEAAASANPHEFVTRRDGDPVAAEYWRAGWFPFARDGGGNAYAADFSPLDGGTYGQVILIGPDEDERRVLAPSVEALLKTAISRPFGAFERGGNMLFFELEDMLRDELPASP